MPFKFESDDCDTSLFVLLSIMKKDLEYSMMRVLSLGITTLNDYLLPLKISLVM